MSKMNKYLVHFYPVLKEVIEVEAVDRRTAKEVAVHMWRHMHSGAIEMMEIKTPPVPEYIELNMNNYNVNDVAQLNDWAIHASKLMYDLVSESLSRSENYSDYLCDKNKLHAMAELLGMEIEDE